jgi:phosphoglycolate phosphatase
MSRAAASRRSTAGRRVPVAVIFDLDGTLVDTVGRRIEAWVAVFAEQRIPVARERVAALIGSDGRWLARLVASEAGLTIHDHRAEAIDVRSGELYGVLNVNPRPLPGARAVTRALDRAGIPWAIATSSRREQVAASVAALGFERAPVVVDGTHVAHAKPAPDLMLRAALELGVAPERAWYVGDSTFDMEAAVAAGMHPIGVTTGAVDAATLRAAGAAEVTESLEAVAERIARLTEGSA